MMVGTQTDPRWENIIGKEWTCASCDDLHTGIIDLAYDWPCHWNGDKTIHPNRKLTLDAENILTEDFCIMHGDLFFVRCIALFPLQGFDDANFGIGLWSSLSKQNFQIYVENFDSDEQDHLGPWFGWLSNSVGLYPETLSLKLQVYPQNNRQRPQVVIEPTDHPLSQDQQNGISYERLTSLYDFMGHTVN